MALYLLVVGIYALIQAPPRDRTFAESKPQTVQLPKKERITPDDLFVEINKVRTDHDLKQFKRNELLDKSSSIKCKDMTENHYYDHQNPKTGKQGYSYVKDLQINYDSVSENLNAGIFYTAKEVIDSWMGSKPHRASILDPRYDEIGFATCTDTNSPDELIIVQHKIESYPPKIN